MKVVSMNFSSVEKQRNHLADEVDKYEEALTQFKVNCDKVQQQYRDCHCALMQAEQQVKIKLILMIIFIFIFI